MFATVKTWLRLYLKSYEGLSRPSWLLALITLINRSGAMVIPFLGIYMNQSLKFDLRETGTVLTFFGLGAVCGSSLGGWLTDKLGHFRVQFASLILSAPIYCILPLLKTPVFLSIGVFILSLITETFRPANSVSIASYSESQNLTKAFSLNRMAINLGFSIGPALGGILAAVSYDFLFYGNAISSALAGLVFYLFFKKQTKKTTAKPTESTQQEKSPWKDGLFLGFSLMSCLYAICFFQILNTLPLFYKEVHRLTEYQIGIIMAFSGFIVFLLEMPLVHFAERKMTPLSAIILGTLLCGTSFGILILPGKFVLLYVSIFIVCISEILALPFMATVSLQRAASGKQGAYMGLNSLCYAVALILSPYIGTRIAYNFSFDSLWLGTAAVSVLICVGFWWILKRM